MAPQEADQGLGDHPNLCFGGEMEVQLSHSHHHLVGHNIAGSEHQMFSITSLEECRMQYKCSI